MNHTKRFRERFVYFWNQLQQFSAKVRVFAKLLTWYYYYGIFLNYFFYSSYLHAFFVFFRKKPLAKKYGDDVLYILKNFKSRLFDFVPLL